MPNGPGETEVAPNRPPPAGADGDGTKKGRLPKQPPLDPDASIGTRRPRQSSWTFACEEAPNPPTACPMNENR